MPSNVAIDGFGPIGRLALRAMLRRHKDELKVVAINDMADLHTNARFAMIQPMEFSRAALRTI